jgi:hypothetical protein
MIIVVFIFFSYSMHATMQSVTTNQLKREWDAAKICSLNSICKDVSDQGGDHEM